MKHLFVRMICLLFAPLALAAMTGCGAVERIGQRGAQTIDEGYALSQDAAQAADEFKAQVAADDFARAKKHSDFAQEIGRQIDAAGIGWLDATLRRHAEFICALHSRGIAVAEIAVGESAAARLECLGGADEDG